jgi:hypothetical protein
MNDRTIGKTMATNQSVFQFRIRLKEIDPEIWRRIEVPGGYTFWDLHVAIQDAMGWQDRHLHAFRVLDPDNGEKVEIGIPDEEEFEDGVEFKAGWEISIAHYFRKAGDKAEYEYDFGDGWVHEIALEKTTGIDPEARYPRCLAGERACPPEDCGGPYGYEELLEILSDKLHEQHEGMMEWLGDRFSPDEFDPKRVRFDDPKKRWETAFGEDE